MRGMFLAGGGKKGYNGGLMAMQEKIPSESAPSALGASAANAPAAPAAAAPLAANPLIRTKQYAIPAADANKRVDGELARLGKSANLKGFRPGKAPLRILRQLYGRDTLQQILVNMANEKFQTELQKTNEPLAALPRYAAELVATADGAYRVNCTYETLPDVAPPDLAGVKLQTPALSIGEKEIDEMTADLQKRYGRYLPHIGGAADGCVITADITTDAEDGGSARENRTVQLGSPQILPEVNAALQGAVAGDVRVVRPTFADNHPDPMLRGKTVEITLAVKRVDALHKAELNEAFFVALGTAPGGGLPAFRKMVEAHLQREVAVRLRNIRQRRAMNKLIETTPPFPLPQSMLQQENLNLLRSAQMLWEQRGGHNIASALTMETFLPEARRRVQLGLILSAWRRRHNPDVSEAQIEERLDDAMEAYENPAQQKAAVRANAQQMEAIRMSVLEDLLTDWVYEQVGGEDEPVGLTELLNDETAGGRQ